jgi:hypothetical protein
MPISHTLKTRLKIVAASLIALAIPTAACGEGPIIGCYVPPPPTDTPAPLVTCYTAPAPTQTPTPFTSPISPLPTPTPTPQARHQLLDQLRAEGRLPESVARQLEG